jgi:ELWxxDGT repeat protein
MLCQVIRIGCVLGLLNLFATTAIAQVPAPKPIKTFKVGSPLFENKDLVWLNNRIFFTADDGRSGQELWSTNGTIAGTIIVKDFAPGGLNLNPNSSQAKIVATNGSQILVQTNIANNPLWVVHKSVSRAVNGLPQEIKTLLRSEMIYEHFVLNGKWIFPARSQGGATLWQIDLNRSQPSAQRLYRFPYLTPDTGLHPQLFTVAGRQAFFTVQGTNGQSQLWRTDGTERGTLSLRNLSPAGEKFVVWQDQVYMEAETPENGWELWTSDGSAKGTQLLQDIVPGTGSAAPRILGSTDRDLFFLANAAKGGIELWATSGTPKTTRLVKRLDNAPSARGERIFAVVGDRMYFVNYRNSAVADLWVTDGTEVGTKQLTNRSFWQISELRWTGNRLVFSAGSPADGGNEPWVSDGTAKGTKQLADLYPGTTTIVPLCPPPIRRPDPSPGQPIPPPPPPQPCPPPSTQPNASNPRQIIVSNGLAYFIADTADTTAVWRSNGTAAGTKAVLRFPKTHQLLRLEQLNDRLVLSGLNENQQPAIWVIN